MQILLHHSDKIVFSSSPFVLLKYTKHTHTNHSHIHTHTGTHTNRSLLTSLGSSLESTFNSQVGSEAKSGREGDVSFGTADTSVLFNGMVSMV